MLINLNGKTSKIVTNIACGLNFLTLFFKVLTYLLLTSNPSTKAINLTSLTYFNFKITLNLSID